MGAHKGFAKIPMAKNKRRRQGLIMTIRLSYIGVGGCSIAFIPTSSRGTSNMLNLFRAGCGSKTWGKRLLFLRSYLRSQSLLIWYSRSLHLTRLTRNIVSRINAVIVSGLGGEKESSRSTSHGIPCGIYRCSILEPLLVLLLGNWSTGAVC